MRRSIIERFRNEHGDKPANRLAGAHARDVVGAKADTPHAASSLLKVLRILFGYAVAIDMIENYAFVGIKKYKTSGGGFHSVTEAEIAKFEA